MILCSTSFVVCLWAITLLFRDAAFDDARSGGDAGGLRMVPSVGNVTTCDIFWRDSSSKALSSSFFRPPPITLLAFFVLLQRATQIGVLCMYYTILHIDTTTTLCPH